MINNDSHSLPTTLKNNTGFLLSWVAAASTQHYENALQTLNLHPHHVGILELVQAHQPIVQSRIGEQLGIFKPIIVKLINELEAKSYVQRLPHPSDKRAVEIHLLPQGADCIKQVRAVSQQATDTFFGALGKAESQQFHNILTKIALSMADEQGKTS